MGDRYVDPCRSLLLWKEVESGGTEVENVLCGGDVGGKSACISVILTLGIADDCLSSGMQDSMLRVTGELKLISGRVGNIER